MSTLPLEYFRCNVVRCTAYGPLFLSIEVQLSGESEISQLYFHFVVEEEVAQFEISVDDAVAMKVLQSVDDLQSVALHFQFVETFSPSEKFVHRLVLTQLQQHVDILCVLEEVLEEDDVGVLDGAVDLDLAHELLLGSGLRKAGFDYDLARTEDVRFLVHHFVATSETSLAQELALSILPNEGLSIMFNDLFLDDRRHIVVICRIGIHISD